MSNQCPAQNQVRGFAALATIVLSGLFGCGSAEPAPARDKRAITDLSADLSTIVRGNNTFAWSLYRAAAGNGGNLFFSPFSISAAFGMTWAGAAGDTATEMRSVLAIGTAGDATYHSGFGALVRDLSGEHPGRGYQLYVANRLFVQAQEPFKPDFLALTSRDYGAGLGEVDYANAAEAARLTINDWVAEQTRDRIPQMLAPGTLDAMTRLVLANAIYFKGDWARQFDPAQTHAAPFRLANGEQVDVTMMRQVGSYRVAHREDVSLIELNYQDDEVSMVVLLPPSYDALPTLEAAIGTDYVDALLAETHEQQELWVSLPRFAFSGELPLTQLLKTLGMVRAFDPMQANFSNALDPAVAPLFLAFAVHKSWVNVDEHGTEATAATGTEFEPGSAPPSFVANHPFLYFIRDRLTGSILFIGRVQNPLNPGPI